MFINNTDSEITWVWERQSIYLKAWEGLGSLIMNVLVRRSLYALRCGPGCAVTTSQMSLCTLDGLNHSKEGELPKASKSTDTVEGGPNEKVVVTDEFEIQPEWLAMERRLAFRKPKLKGEGKEGRSPLRESAWDAEHV